MATEAFAPAKVNLTLHITGRRADGYHLLDSLVAFAAVGDRIRAQPADALGLTVTGPAAQGLTTGPDNLVLRAARLIGNGRGATLTLHKVLPTAAGLGGGSADAAATLRALADLWHIAMPTPDAILGLGADVPVCLAGRPARMSGIGDQITPLAAALPPAALVLVNPGQALSTAAVFTALARHDHPPMPPSLPSFADAATLAAFLAAMRNDLETPAIRLAPVIAEVRAALAAQPGCLLARMSGSGATCFGLFADHSAAETAARKITRDAPHWWVAAAPVLR